MKKYTQERPFPDAEAAARKLVEIAAGIEPVQDAASTSKRSMRPSSAC